ncbi:helix-turn-helix transcriptional regulator [Parvibaculum sp.]|uniref:helix-turn-helix domain-containing protein n=1 Tax=Parvibaculum sp. TaxID=2024848 RepID=UPI000C8C6FF8|nr:helix-turn-helix transcriptional regulator [Parvibaculum sp.]MAB14965.1 hypothetical protein [Parvibaculum sp.]
MTQKHDDDGVQRIAGANGEPAFVVLPVARYDALKKAAERDSAAATLEHALTPVPAPVARRIANGENPVRVWREHRRMKAIDLARSAGVGAPYLSEIETGKKDGSFRTMAAIADVLRVSLDDLAPVTDTGRKRARQRAALINSVNAQVRTLLTLVGGDFDTAAVRRAVTQLVSDAVSLKMQDPELAGWIDDMLESTRMVLDLIDRAEQDIIDTAQRARLSLEELVSGPGFRRKMAVVLDETGGDEARETGPEIIAELTRASAAD